MSLFIIRVELHEANWQHYVEMAKDLASKGITDVITADNGNSYKMSPAEYNYIGTESLETVLEAVKTCAAKTGKRYAVFVTEAKQTKWIGLDVVQARRTA
jgi:hypothetical protein